MLLQPGHRAASLGHTATGPGLKLLWSKLCQCASQSSKIGDGSVRHRISDYTFCSSAMRHASAPGSVPAGGMLEARWRQHLDKQSWVVSILQRALPFDLHNPAWRTRLGVELAGRSCLPAERDGRPRSALLCRQLPPAPLSLIFNLEIEPVKGIVVRKLASGTSGCYAC